MLWVHCASQTAFTEMHIFPTVYKMLFYPHYLCSFGPGYTLHSCQALSAIPPQLPRLTYRPPEESGKDRVGLQSSISCNQCILITPFGFRMGTMGADHALWECSKIPSFSKSITSFLSSCLHPGASLYGGHLPPTRS